MKLVLLYTVITVFSLKMATAQQWTNYPDLKYVEAITLDSLNNLWFGGSSGVTKYDGTSWTKYLKQYVWALKFDAKGNILAGTDLNGFYVFNGTQWTQYTTADGLIKETVYSIAIDSLNNIWLGCGDMSGNGGVSMFDGSFFTNYSTKDGLPQGNVLTVAIDHLGNKWVGTSNGLSKFDGTSWTNFNKDNGLVYDDVKEIFIDNLGDIWVVTQQSGGAGPSTAGLSKFNGTSWTRISGFSVGYISDIVEDSLGNKWMATDQGVFVYNGENWKTYSISDGLINNNVYSIGIDLQGNKWFGTSGGVSMFCETCIPNSVNEKIDSDVQIFPNPTSNIIKIIFHNTSNDYATAVINNIQGQEVFRKDIVIERIAEIDVSEIGTGIFFLTLTSGNETFSKKIVVIK